MSVTTVAEYRDGSGDHTPKITPDQGAEFALNDWLRIIRNAKLGRTTKYVAFVMASYADPDGTRVFPGTARLAVDCELSYDSVKRARRVLVRAGLVVLHKRGNRRAGKSDEYRLAVPEDLLDRVQVRTPDEVRDAAAELSAKVHAKDTDRARRRRANQGAGTPGPDHAAPSRVPRESTGSPPDQGAGVPPETPIRGQGCPDSGGRGAPPPIQSTTPQQRTIHVGRRSNVPHQPRADANGDEIDQGAKNQGAGAPGSGGSSEPPAAALAELSKLFAAPPVEQQRQADEQQARTFSRVAATATTCDTCDAYLDPDGSCFVCAMTRVSA